MLSKNEIAKSNADRGKGLGMIIKAVGDICPGDKLIMGAGVLSKTLSHGVDFPLRRAKPVLQESDLVLANFEGLLTAQAESGQGGGRTFCGLPGFADAMLDAGIQVVNIANNHALEHGPAYFMETIDLLKRSGLKVCGLRSANGKFYSEPVIINIKGRTIGILGYNWVGVENFERADDLIAQSPDSLVNYTWDRTAKRKFPGSTANSRVLADIHRLRPDVDILILMTHWGYEFVTVPPYHVTVEARTFIDAGVDIIFGGHPHVLQGTERYKEGLVFYSLGNFIFDFRRRLTRHTGIAEVVLKGNRVAGFHIEPFFINSAFQPSKTQREKTRTVNCIIAESNESILSPNKNRILDDDKLYKSYEKYYNHSKLLTIVSHFFAIKENPAVAKLIAEKAAAFFKMFQMRMKGQRVRW